MSVCPSCRARLPAGAGFCPACGARVSSPPSFVQERRVVTTLFCDLVDFTRMSEGADPEDVDHMLRAFARVARHAVELHGGAIEKFVGDAVVATFGVPIAHEDDAERAVHAALRIRRQVAAAVTTPEGAPVTVRIGINTGEVLARLDLAPAIGEGILAGDAVNTAARLQAAAPPAGILVGPATYALTSRLFQFEELEPVALKGKREPLPVWLVHAAASRTGADRADHPSAFVGRRPELTHLDRLLGRVVSERSARTVLVAGEAGIGKSRLLTEFYRRLDERPEQVTWRQGRCLPYGEETVFWPLGEIVKAQAGILDTDGIDVAERKLGRTLPEGPEGQWVRDRLRPLVGLRAPATPLTESFSAWNRFLFHLAQRHPLVLVVEDLHWADDAMVSYLLQLATQDQRAPLLLLLTARTAFLHGRPDVVETLGPDGLITLSSLTVGETEDLLASRGADKAGIRRLAPALADRCGGNPLYIEETLRLMRERGLIPDSGALTPEATTALPGSVQAVIAARIDALSVAQKECLTNAAVVGRRFWDGALAALAADRAALDDVLDRLVAAELIRQAPLSSMAGQREYVFWHALTRDVAYGRLTRMSRAEKHERVAHWLEEQTGGRAHDAADVLAHHYLTAFETRLELGDADGADSLRRPAARALHLAGSRAFGLSVTAARRDFERAATLLPPVSEERPKVLLAWAEALIEDSELTQAIAVLEEGIGLAREMGDDRAAAMALPRLSYARWLRGDGVGAAASAEAVRLLERYGSSPELLSALESWAGDLAHLPDCRLTVAVSDRARRVAAELGVREGPAALAPRGMARCCLGDAGGLGDLRAAVERAREMAEQRWLIACQCNLGDQLCIFDGPAAARTVHLEALASTSRFGGRLATCYCREVLFVDAVFGGEWEEARREATSLDAVLMSHGDMWDLVHFRATAALLLALVGDRRAAEAWARFAVDGSRTTPMQGTRVAALTGLAQVLCDSGDPEGARTCLVSCARLPRDVRGHFDYVLRLPHMVRLAHRIDDRALADDLVQDVPLGARYARLAVSVARARAAETGEPAVAEALWRSAADGWLRLGSPYEQAHSLAGRGRCLLQAGERRPARDALLQAAASFEQLGAAHDARETRRIISLA